MAGFDWCEIDKIEGAVTGRLEPPQLMAAAAPYLPLKQLAREAAHPASSGNFKDLESLLDQLGSPPLFELGNPLPNAKFLPKRGLGDCPAAHNRALLDEEPG
jgi:hypothetical protein